MAGRDSSALFNRIYDATNQQVLAFLTARCRKPSDVSDLFQDTYLELFAVINRRGASYIRSEAAFVLRLAHRKLSRYYKRLGREAAAPLFDEEADNGSALAEAEEAVSVEELGDDRALLSQVREALAQKPPETQKIFVLVYGLGKTLSETARLLGRKESYVKSRLYRTLGELRSLYAAKEELSHD